jgi:hypothetical protein
MCNVARASYECKRIKTSLGDKKGKEREKWKKKRANYLKYE